jgi:hypothetical protein
MVAGLLSQAGGKYNPKSEAVAFPISFRFQVRMYPTGSKIQKTKSGETA